MDDAVMCRGFAPTIVMDFSYQFRVFNIQSNWKLMWFSLFGVGYCLLNIVL